jgi:MFS family permease
MTDAVVETERPRATAAASAWYDRVAAIVPIATVYFWLCILYAWESRGHKTPWVFGDELKMAQVSRPLAHGDPSPHGFQTLYSYLLAPAWWIDDMHRAYATVKYIGILTMTAVVFPTYLLARMLVSKPAALFAAAAAGAVPALMYSTMLIPEPLAYPYAALCFYLITKALVTKGRWWIGGAVAACIVAPFVRGELALIPFAFALALLFLGWTGERAKRWRSTWSTGDWVGFVALAFGALIVFNLFVGRHSTSFTVATGHYKHRMFVYGIWAAGAFTIGLGILPVIAGIAALFKGRGERRTREMRVFTAVGWALIIGFGAYAAIKASYLSTVFATRVEERNLIYLAPFLMVGTAIWLDRPRLRPLGLAVGAVFTLYAILHTPYQLDTRLSIDAPGLSILALGNRDLAFDNDATKWVLVVAFVIAIALLVAPRLFHLSRAAVYVCGGLAAALVVAWALTGQIAASNSSNATSQAFVSGQPHPTDWVERVTHGAPTMYLGQNITDPNGVWGLEFWNPSIKYVWSLDSTVPGPWPTEPVTPNIDGVDGHLQQQRGEVQYVVTEPGIDVVGKPAGQGFYLAAGQPTPWTLTKIDYPVRLRHSQSGVFSDGWMGSDASYTQFSTKRKKPGYAVVILSRQAWGGTDVPGHVTIRVGTLGIKDVQPYMARETARQTWTIHSHGCRQFVIPSPAPPMRVEVHISPTFVPYELDPSTGDRRKLGAIVSMGFSDRKPTTDPCAG